MNNGNNGATKPEDSSFFLKRLSENAPAFVQRSGSEPDIRHSGMLVGNVRDQYLVLAVFDGSEFGTGERLVVRMALGAQLVGFETVVLKKFDDPLLYLVDFPQHIDAINLRKAQRIQAFFPADVKVSTAGAEQVLLLKTRVLDISAGGCSFRSKTKLPTSVSAHLTFALPGDRQIQSVKAAVIDSLPVGAVFHCRAKFIQEPTYLPNLQEIAKWVAEGVSFGAKSA